MSSTFAKVKKAAKKLFTPQDREAREHHKMQEANRERAVAIFNNAVEACRELGWEIGGEMVLLNPMQAIARVNIFAIKLDSWKKRKEQDKPKEEKANTEAVGTAETGEEAPKASEVEKEAEATGTDQPERKEGTEKTE